MQRGSYEWIPGWVELSEEPEGWMHSGVAVTDQGVVVAHPGKPALLVYDDGGTLLREIPLPGLLEPHGFHVVADGLWIGDVGFKRHVRGPDFETERRPGRVVLVDDDGRVLRELADPGSGWSPTAIAVDEETGDVWVADGYGNSLVHRFEAGGEHRQTLTGEEGAGRFDCPHGVLVHRRELYVSDRANGRIQVFDPGGRFVRVVGAGVLVTPTDTTVAGELLAVTDFTKARVTLLDLDGRLVEHLGANPAAPERDGWPNARDERGDLARPKLETGAFNSPHTLCADAGGNLYVTEWLLGGRLTKLARAR